MKNQLSRKFKAHLNKSEWDEICPPMEYRVIDGSQAYALGIVPPKMMDVNSVAIGASGSNSGTIMYFANYFRVDGRQIDQEPYFELYESTSDMPVMYGIFHHASFPGRTETLSDVEFQKIAASGSTTDIQFTAKPTRSSGSLEDLRTEGKIIGFEYTWQQGIKRKP